MWFGHGDVLRGDGLSTYTRDVVAELRARGVRVLLVTSSCDGRPPPSEPDRLVLKGTRVNALTVSSPGSMRRVKAALRSFKPHIVHVSWSFSSVDKAICVAAHRAGAVTTATVHLPWAPRKSRRQRLLRLVYRYNGRALVHVDHVASLSSEQSRLMMAVGVPENRLTVVPNGVNTEVITPGASAMRDRLGPGVVVAYLGRLDAEKRVPALLEAVTSRRWSEPWHLLIGGDGRQARRLRRLAAPFPSVHLSGLLQGPAERLDLLRAADIFVLPSSAEGLSLSMLEAMSVGAAVIATDVGDDGAALAGCGIVLPVTPLRPHLDEALDALHEDPGRRATLGAAARQRCVERYSLSRVVDDLAALYGRALSADAPADRIISGRTRSVP